MSARVPLMVQGADELARKLGGWPSFHDAEVTDLCLNRTGESTLSLQLADRARTVIVFVLVDVSGLELSEFNRQNVIGSLDVQSDGGDVVVHLAPCYGINGSIRAKAARVRIR